MSLSLSEVKHPQEFDELVQCECESYRTPLDPLFRLFRYDDSPAGFIELRDRQVCQWEGDPTSHWLKVVDTELGSRVIGAANWNIFLENPYGEAGDDKRKAVADWWPEGIAEADRLNLEMFTEATNDGKPCYEASGFVYMGTNYLEAAKRKPSAKWMELERYLHTPIHTYLMWRPVDGKFVEGETKAPWEE